MGVKRHKHHHKTGFLDHHRNAFVTATLPFLYLNCHNNHYGFFF